MDKRLSNRIINQSENFVYSQIPGSQLNLVLIWNFKNIGGWPENSIWMFNIEDLQWHENIWRDIWGFHQVLNLSEFKYFYEIIIDCPQLDLGRGIHFKVVDIFDPRSALE